MNFPTTFFRSAVLAGTVIGAVPAALASEIEQTARPSFSGFYLGAGGGVSGGELSQRYLPAGRHDLEQDLGTFGGFGYVQAGYDREIAHGIVGGVFVDYVATDEAFAYKSAPTANGRGRAPTKQRKKWSFGGRLGAMLDPNQMWFVSAGVAQAKYTFALEGFGPNSGQTESSVRGWFLGAGASTRLSDAISVDIEARYEDFERERFHSNPNSHWFERPTSLGLRAGLSYRFFGSRCGADGERCGAPFVSQAKWDGFYVGAGAGLGAFSTMLDRDLSGTDSHVHSADGKLGFLQVGYDRRFAERWLVGAFADYTVGSKHAFERARDLYVKHDPEFAGGLRLGYLASPGALVFASVGASRHHVSAGNNAYEIHEKDVWGVFAGIGTETSLTDDLYLKMEYRLDNLDGKRFHYTSGSNIQEVTDAREHSARVSLNFRLGQ